MQNAATGEIEKVEDPKVAQELKADGHCVLHVGEAVDIKGGKFRVSSLGKKMIVLEGLPKTSIVEEDLSKSLRDTRTVLFNTMVQRDKLRQVLIHLLLEAGGSKTISVAELEKIPLTRKFKADANEEARTVTFTVVESQPELKIVEPQTDEKK